MAYTMQNIVDVARLPLNDADKTRYPDATLLAHANQAVLEAFNRRPDLFFDNYDGIPDLNLTLNSPFPMPLQYAQVVSDYVTARAESVEDEYANPQRAAAFMQMMAGALNG